MPTIAPLSITPRGDRELVIRRDFAAPRALVFAAYTEPALVRRWLGALPGWTMPVCEIDLRVGGRYRYVWENADLGTRMGMGGEYREITAPHGFVATEKFDESWYPGEALCTLVLTERGGVTSLTQTMTYQSKEALEAVLKSGMEHGLRASFDRLEETLTSS